MMKFMVKSLMSDTFNYNYIDGTNNTQINKIITHLKGNVLISGHENKYIRFYDINSGIITYLSQASNIIKHNVHIQCSHI